MPTSILKQVNLNYYKEKKYSSRKETIKHIRKVRKTIFKIIWQLFKRALFHDGSKLGKYEKAGFDIYTPKLKGLTYGSDEYKQCLQELGQYLRHHYDVNSHHPEHYTNGIKGMCLVDIVEMLCDWYAATKRHNDGNIFKSIELNKSRFNYSDDLADVFRNTVQHRLLEV